MSADPYYIQTCALPDICGQCGDYDKVTEVRTLLGEKVVATLCLECLERSEFL